MLLEKQGGIYVHIPFCRNKCIYCDFYTGGARIADWYKYTDALINEAKRRKEELNFSPVTLYIGGGTPSLMPLEEFKRLVLGIAEISGVDKWKEFTIEVNPEDVTLDKMKGWKEYGVNRVSIGIQSLNDEELKTIGRNHDAATGLKALEMLKEGFSNISADVMFGLPNQTIESYRHTLNALIERKISHISAYSLMLEEGTALTHLWKKNRVKLPEEEEWIEMFELTAGMFKEAGYQHYEISNFALDDKTSKHNQLYWTGNPYIGLGAGAHSYDGGKIRRSNPNDIKGYVNFYSDDKALLGDKLFYDREILTEEEQMEERIMTRLRTSRGLDLEDFTKRFGSEEMNILLRKARKYINSGLLKEEERRLILTEKGIMIYNDVVSSLI